MSDQESISFYNTKVSERSERYETLRFEDVHQDILDFLPSVPGAVLDIGAGSGRDAAWFASKGWDVVAVEPAAQMMEQARLLHPEPEIRWIQDKLPGLEQTLRAGVAFDVILISAVWMHVKPTDRARAFRKIVSLLKPSGQIFISLRHGVFDDGRTSYPVSVDELENLARQNGVAVRRAKKSTDRLGRDDITWETVCLQLPDDGTEALPLLRHTILRDSKSSTYKLALLRVLVRIADSAIGVVRDVDDDFVKIPLGLVALYWLRMYKPLIEKQIPQAPSNKNSTGLGFVKEAFWDLKNYSPQDLRVGARFNGGQARSLVQALIDARDTIKKMPAFFITYPNSSEQVFKASVNTRVAKSDSFVLSDEFLWSFGELAIPRHIWLAMTRFACWIEPLLINEWIALMQTYGEKQGARATYDDLIRALTWIDPERDTNLVRSISTSMMNSGQEVLCVWSGKTLKVDSCDIDHCFPFAAWPCGDLWNLMPADRRLNQNSKGDKLVSASLLDKASKRIFDWWNAAYCANNLNERFLNEASVSLPVDGLSEGAIAQILEGMLLKRSALKRDLQITDWDYS